MYIDKPENESVISVYNAVGQLVAAIPVIPTQSEYTLDLNVSPGVYLVKTEVGGMIYFEKFVVK